GRDMDDARAADPLGDLRQPFAVAPGKDIDLVAHGRQVACQLADVQVLPATIDPAQDAQRRGVLADDGDALAHAPPPTPTSSPGTGTPPARPATCAKVSSQSPAKRAMPN